MNQSTHWMQPEEYSAADFHKVHEGNGPFRWPEGESDMEEVRTFIVYLSEKIELVNVPVFPSDAFDSMIRIDLKTSALLSPQQAIVD